MKISTQLQSQISMNDCSSIIMDTNQQQNLNQQKISLTQKKKFSLPLVLCGKDQQNNEKIKAKKRWKMLQNVFLSVRQFRSQTVSNIDSPEKLQADFNHFCISPLKKSNVVHPIPIYPSAVHEYQIVDQFIKFAENGSYEAEQEMKRIIYKDPKKHVYSTSDCNHFINQKNKHGQNALYIACKNGHSNIVKLLLSYKCNAFIESIINGEQKEDPLSVSVRWMHIDCIQMLLEFVTYPKSHLKKISKQTQNITIKKMLGENQDSWLCCF